MHLELSRLSRWAESPVGRILPLDAHRRPSAIRAIAQPPVFGLDLYRTLSQAKIILNGAIDMAGGDRGNMRCFEAMGTGGLLLSDAGQYPDGMSDGTTLVSYADEAGAVSAIRRLLADATDSAAIANRGHAMVSDRYSKERQWLQFQALAG
jgi:spore maturation protein CgeB